MISLILYSIVAIRKIIAVGTFVTLKQLSILLMLGGNQVLVNGLIRVNTEASLSLPPKRNIDFGISGTNKNKFKTK
jgi:hypothetical protein